MAKTIEERAREYANKEAGGEYHTGFEGALWEESYESYKEIATEQRERDIEKACDAYCKVCGHFAHTVPTHICRHDCEYYTRFKHIMEERQ